MSFENNPVSAPLLAFPPSPWQVLVSNPWLLSWSLAAGIQQRKAALTEFVSPSAASALLAQAPYLLSVPPDNLSAILATLAELDPPLPLPQVLSSCPRLLSAEPGDMALSLYSLGTAVPALNMTALVLKEPALLPKLAQGAVDVGERVRQWSEEFPSIEVATLFAKHPPLIGMDVSVRQKRHTITIDPSGETCTLRLMAS